SSSLSASPCHPHRPAVSLHAALNKRRILNYVEPATRRTRWDARWLPWVAPAVFFVLTVAMFGGILFSSDRVLGSPGTDITLQFIPWRTFGFVELAKGHL